MLLMRWASTTVCYLDGWIREDGMLRYDKRDCIKLWIMARRKLVDTKVDDGDVLIPRACLKMQITEIQCNYFMRSTFADFNVQSFNRQNRFRDWNGTLSPRFFKSLRISS